MLDEDDDAMLLFLSREDDDEEMLPLLPLLDGRELDVLLSPELPLEIEFELLPERVLSELGLELELVLSLDDDVLPLVLFDDVLPDRLDEPLLVDAGDRSARLPLPVSIAMLHLVAPHYLMAQV